MFIITRRKPEEFAREGEVFLTNHTIRSDDERNTREATEAYFREKYPSYDLRFDYRHLILGGRLVSSVEFGFATTDLPFGKAWGVAIYGREKPIEQQDL